MAGKIIRKLRESKGYTQTSLGDILNLSPSTIGMYEQGRRLPDVETLIKMCDFFNVSSDYLLEISDNPTPYSKSHSEESIPFRLDNLIKESGIDEGTLAEMAKIRKSRLDDILSGKSPNINELKLLAECLWESTDFLLGIRTHLRDSFLSGTYPFPMNPLTLERIQEVLGCDDDEHLASELGITTEELFIFYHYGFIPHISVLIELCHIRNVSCDYILGLSNSTLNIIKNASSDEELLIDGYRKLGTYYQKKLMVHCPSKFFSKNETSL